MAIREINLQSKYEALAKLPEHNPNPVFQIQRDGIITLANEASRNLFHDEDLISKNWLNIFPDFSKNDWQQILESKDAVKYERTIFDCIYIFTFTVSEKRDFVYAYGNDVTGFRRAQQQLTEQARFPEMNPGPVFRMNVEGFILLANAAARRIFGEKIIGNCWFDLFPVMNKSEWAKVLASKQVLPYESQVQDKYYVFAHLHDEVK